jgi:hypothetical protein
MNAKQEFSQALNLSRMINHPRLHELTRVLELPTQIMMQKEITSIHHVGVSELNLTVLA